MLGEQAYITRKAHARDRQERRNETQQDATNVQLASQYNCTILGRCARRVTVAFYSNWMIAILPDAHWRQRRQRSAWKIARKHTPVRSVVV